MTGGKFGEPWRFDRTDGMTGPILCHGTGADDAPFVAVAHVLMSAASEERALRAVACVNACAGLPDPSVVPEMFAALADLVRVRDEYVHGEIDGFERAVDRFIDVADAARSALRAARGEV